MTGNSCGRRVGAWSALAVLLLACGGGHDDDDAVADGGADGDADADGDTDADADADTDADADADAGPDAGSACDADGDGARALACGGDDCDDAAPAVRPGALDGPVFVLVDTGWLTSTLADTSGYVPGGLAADPSGWAALAYADVLGDLHHATNEAGAWATEVVRDNAGGWASLALDGSGASHVAFADATPLREGTGYASNAGGVWHTEPVSTDLPALNGAIAVDADGVPGVAYDTTNLVARRIGWTVRQDGDWAAEGTGEPADGPPVVALDADGEPFICFTNGGTVRVVFRDAVGWTAESAGNGRCSGVAVAADGTVHATSTSESQYEPGPLTHHVRLGDDSWQSEEVATDAILQAPIALDPDGFAHVAFRQVIDGVTTLAYATNRDGAWSTSPLAEPADGHRLGGPALAVDATGAVHVAHLAIPTGPDADGAAVELWYARFAPPNGADDDCDGGRW